MWKPKKEKRPLQKRGRPERHLPVLKGLGGWPSSNDLTDCSGLIEGRGWYVDKSSRLLKKHEDCENTHIPIQACKHQLVTL